MAVVIERIVTSVRRDDRDDITHLLGAWGTVDAATVRAQIARGVAAYFVETAEGLTPVTLLQRTTGDFLFANWDGTGLNNLDQLTE